MDKQHMHVIRYMNKLVGIGSDTGIQRPATNHVIWFRRLKLQVSSCNSMLQCFNENCLFVTQHQLKGSVRQLWVVNIRRPANAWPVNFRLHDCPGQELVSAQDDYMTCKWGVQVTKYRASIIPNISATRHVTRPTHDYRNTDEIQTDRTGGTTHKFKLLGVLKVFWRKTFAELRRACHDLTERLAERRTTTRLSITVSTQKVHETWARRETSTMRDQQQTGSEFWEGWNRKTKHSQWSAPGWPEWNKSMLVWTIFSFHRA